VVFEASDHLPEIGRLYHHLAILARPKALQQLFFYFNALGSAWPVVAEAQRVLCHDYLDSLPRRPRGRIKPRTPEEEKNIGLCGHHMIVPTARCKGRIKSYLNQQTLHPQNTASTWQSMVTRLSLHLSLYYNHSHLHESPMDTLPAPEKNDFRPTPEDFALRGLL
jgi:hypothetical protein